MKIISEKHPETELKTMEAWKEAFVDIDGDPGHWRDGFSACSLAKYFLGDARKAESTIKETLNRLLGDDPVESLDEGIVEHECPFDDYGKPRRQDIGVFGKTKGGKRLYVGIEAKVNEPFDKTIGEKLEDAERALRENPRSNSGNRIKELCEWFGVSENDEKIQSLRYQLFHFAKATANIDADICVLLVLTFETTESDAEKQAKNAADWNEFASNFFDEVPGGYRLKPGIAAKPVYAATMTEKP